MILIVLGMAILGASHLGYKHIAPLDCVPDDGAGLEGLAETLLDFHAVVRLLQYCGAETYHELGVVEEGQIPRDGVDVLDWAGEEW